MELRQIKLSFMLQRLSFKRADHPDASMSLIQTTVYLLQELGPILAIVSSGTAGALIAANSPTITKLLYTAKPPPLSMASSSPP